MEKLEKKSYSHFALRIAGGAGDGLQSTGKLFQKYLNRLGYYFQGFPGTQSTIRGGHVWQHVEFSVTELYSFDRPIDLLIALNSQSIDIHLVDLKPNGFLIYNLDKINIENYEKALRDKKINLVEIPLTKMARDIEMRKSVLANTVAIGATINLLGLSIDPYLRTLAKRFGNKSSIFEMNKIALNKGYDYLSENYKDLINSFENVKTDNNTSIVISGNEIIALGAAASGLKFLSQYPITPASSILTYLSHHAQKFGIVVRQAEDELAAITTCIGASFAGARSMTASSGPGLSLMSEAFGYASMTETPIVIVNAMRAGPSTGVPTKMEQADLMSMIHMSHGESPRLIFAPRNIREAFDVTVRAFNMADKYQMPAIILSDFSLSERTTNVKEFSLDVEINRGKIWTETGSEYKRYEFTNDGISSRVFPPTKGGNYILVGAEHDQSSHSLSGNRCGLAVSGELREKMFDKRFRKLEAARMEMSVPEFYGIDNADHTIICWGSIEGAIKATVDRLNSRGGDKWNMLCFVDLFPLPYSKIKLLLDRIKHSIMYEVNYNGQFEELLHRYLDWRADESIHPLSGETPVPTYIINEIDQLLNSGFDVA